MKKFSLSLLLIAMISFLSIPMLYSFNMRDTEPDVPVDLRERHKTEGTDRTLSGNVEATYIVGGQCIEIDGFEIGEAHVYVLNVRGRVIVEEVFDFSENSSYMIDVPNVSGTYWLVIDSPVIYAEGSFVVE